jgi:molybdenum cofactor biosynthesis enzyme
LVQALQGTVAQDAEKASVDVDARSNAERELVARGALRIRHEEVAGNWTKDVELAAKGTLGVEVAGVDAADESDTRADGDRRARGER